MYVANPFCLTLYVLCISFVKYLLAVFFLSHEHKATLRKKLAIIPYRPAKMAPTPFLIFFTRDRQQIGVGGA